MATSTCAKRRRAKAAGDPTDAALVVPAATCVLRCAAQDVTRTSVLYRTASAQMRSILSHVRRLVPERYSVGEATAYFRVHPDGHLYLLYIPSIQLITKQKARAVRPLARAPASALAADRACLQRAEARDSARALIPTTRRAHHMNGATGHSDRHASPRVGFCRPADSLKPARREARTELRRQATKRLLPLPRVRRRLRRCGTDESTLPRATGALAEPGYGGWHRRWRVCCPQRHPGAPRKANEPQPHAHTHHDPPTTAAAADVARAPMEPKGLAP